MDDLNFLNTIETVALTLKGEAENQPIHGIIAVGCVIRNRLTKNPNHYKTLKDVCLEPKQFSCWNEFTESREKLLSVADLMLRNYKQFDSYFRQCMWVAHGIVEGNIRDNIKGRMYYMTRDYFDNHRPNWAKNAKNEIQIGDHVFFDV